MNSQAEHAGVAVGPAGLPRRPPHPLRLALVRRRYAPFGGAERFIERSLDALQAMGVEATLLCAEWDRPGNANTGWEVARLEAPSGLTRARRELNFEREVWACVSSRKFDLVQSHERIPGLPVFRAGDGLHCEWLRQRARVQNRAAQWLTRLDPYHRFCLARERQMFEHPDLRVVICNSEMVRGEIAQHFPAALPKVRVIRNGIDTRRFAPPSAAQRHQARAALSIPGELPLFVFVGSGFERKGVATILRIAALLPGAQFLVVGQDKRLPDHVRESARLGVTQRVRFLGATKDVQSCLAAGDAFLFPTLYDPGPNAVLEALAMGLPVLTSTKCGLAELVVPAGAGQAHDALDAQAFAASAIQMLDGARRASMATAARGIALQLSLEHLAGQLRSLYEELLG